MRKATPKEIVIRSSEVGRNPFSVLKTAQLRADKEAADRLRKSAPMHAANVARKGSK